MRFMYKTLKAVRFLFMAPFILAMLFVINWATYSGDWWFKWAALGIGIAWCINLLRVIRAVILVGGIAALVAYFRNRQH